MPPYDAIESHVVSVRLRVGLLATAAGATSGPGSLVESP